MTARPPGAPVARAMPLAMVTLDVAGQIRERNPVDRALFGERAGRFAERFVDAAAGQSLLARAIAEGYAETDARLKTGGGPQSFHIAVWRQRGGERIRLLAVFAGKPQDRFDPAPSVSPAARRALREIAHDLRGPLEAIIALAGRIRGLAQGEGRKAEAGEISIGPVASDLLAAVWRLRGVGEEIDAAARSGQFRSEIRVSEVDLARLVRRIIRLARAATEGPGIEIDIGGLPLQGRGPAVLTDQRRLWSVVERLVVLALERAGAGGRVAVSLSTDDASDALCLEITAAGGAGEMRSPAAPEATDSLVEAAGEDGLDTCRRLAREAGAEFEIDSDEGGVRVRLLFPPGRCLDPV